MEFNKNNFSIDVFHNAKLSNLESFESTDKERQQHLITVLKENLISGNILEFGVFEGTTINIIAKLFPNDIIWGFDSFEGLPEDWKTRNDSPIKYTKGYFSLKKMPEVLPNVKLVKGWFNETIPNWVENYTENIKFLHVDADLYSSTKDILFLLNSKIVPGTIICFDDMYCWNNLKWYTEWENGEYRALSEWLSKFNRAFVPLYRSNYMQCSIKITK